MVGFSGGGVQTKATPRPGRGVRLPIRLVHHQHGRKHNSTQEDTVLGKELRVLHVDPQQQEERLTLGLA